MTARERAEHVAARTSTTCRQDREFLSERIEAEIREAEEAAAAKARLDALEEAARVVEMADLFWHLGDPRARIAVALRERARKERP